MLLVCFFFNCWEERLWHTASLFQNSICLYPAGKRKELGLLDSKGFSKEIKRWHTSNTHLLVLTSGFSVNKTKKGTMGDRSRVLQPQLTEQYADSRPYVLNSPPEIERTAIESIWFPHSRIKPPLLGAHSQAHTCGLASPYLRAFPRKLVLSTWQLPSDLGTAQHSGWACGMLMDSCTAEDVTGRQSEVYRDFLGAAPQTSALNGLILLSEQPHKGCDSDSYLKCNASFPSVPRRH